MGSRNLFFALFTVLAMQWVSQMKGATYENPIIAEDAPDPSVIRGNDGYYYLFSTAEHVYRSKNLTTWNYVGQVFDGGVRPTFVEGVNTYWAPCVTKQNGRYVMYFALSKWGGGDTAAIGVATADKPKGPYTIVGDGKLFTSAEVGVNNSIDPNFIEYNGHKYIVWGSWNGIWLIELTADGLAVKNIRVKRQLAGTRFEAPYIYRHGRYFYLFCSIGACCEGENSTYETVVGRSTSLYGPYVTKDGRSMLDNAYELFLTSNTPCIAPGHNSRIIEDEEGRTWMTYHGYLRSDPDKGRMVWLDEVKWVNGWPYIEGNGASTEYQEDPVVTPYSLDVDEVHTEWGVEQGMVLPVDLTNDGRMSLLVTGLQTNRTTGTNPWNAVLRQNSDGIWQTVQNGLPKLFNPSITAADFVGDGQLELLVLGAPHETTNPDDVANGIYRIQSDSTFSKVEVNMDGADFAELTAATVADVNRDGRPDIVAVGPQSRNVVLLATEERAFQTATFTDSEITYNQILSADFNADGIADLFAYSTTSAELFLGDGNGGFSPTNWMNDNSAPTDGGVSVADVNSDNTLDIIYTTAESPVLCLNDGIGHFTRSTAFTLAFQNGFCSVASAQLFDWNGDKYPDFFYQGVYEPLGVTTGALWSGSSKGSFTHKYRYGAGGMAAIAFLDWNGDGVPDLVTTGNTTDTHLFPFDTGQIFTMTLNPNAVTTRRPAPSKLESQVEGNVVHLSWNRSSANNTYEMYVRDDQGKLYGNVRSYIDELRNGQRKVMAFGNCGTAGEITMMLPLGHYTWGVQCVNTRFEGSRFSTGEFTVTTDAVAELPSMLNVKEMECFNTLGQRVPVNYRGLRLIRYSDGSVRKSVTGERESIKALRSARRR